MGHPIRSLTKKIYPEVTSTYQAVGALLVSVLNERWKSRGEGLIYEVLFSQVNGLAGEDSIGGWTKTWGNWGRIKSCSNPFAGNSPYHYDDVLVWALKRKLITALEREHFGSMFFTLTNWEENVIGEPSDMHDDVISIIDLSAEIGRLNLAEPKDMSPKLVYVDADTGNYFDGIEGVAIFSILPEKINRLPKIRDAALQVISAGESLLALVPAGFTAADENEQGIKFSGQAISVSKSMLYEEGESLIRKAHECGGIAELENFMKRMHSAAKVLGYKQRK